MNQQVNPLSKALGFLGLFVLTAIGAFYYFIDLSQWESTGGQRRFNKFIFLAYKAGGVKGVITFFWIIALLFWYAAVHHFQATQFKNKKAGLIGLVAVLLITAISFGVVISGQTKYSEKYEVYDSADYFVKYPANYKQKKEQQHFPLPNGERLNQKIMTFYGNGPIREFLVYMLEFPHDDYLDNFSDQQLLDLILKSISLGRATPSVRYRKEIFKHGQTGQKVFAKGKIGDISRWILLEFYVQADRIIMAMITGEKKDIEYDKRGSVFFKSFKVVGMEGEEEEEKTEKIEPQQRVDKSPKTKQKTKIQSKKAAKNLVQTRVSLNFKTKLIHTSRKTQRSAPQPPMEVFKRIHYSGVPGKLVAYITPDPKNGKARPAIIWAHGGFDGIGDWLWKAHKYTGAYRSAGFIVMCPAWRGENDNPGNFELFYGEVQDALAAIEYVKKLSYVDPSRIYFAGHSAGGTIALLVAESTKEIRAVFSLGGAPDLHQIVQDGEGYGNTPFDYNNRQESYLRSPIHFVSAIYSPTFYFEGQDSTYTDDALRMQEKAHAKNKPFSAFIISDADHFNILEPINDLIARKIFFDKEAKCNIKFTQKEVDAAFEKAMKMAKNFLQRGVRDYKKKNFGSAIACFTRSIGYNNKNAKVYYMRGLCKYRQKNYASALADYDVAIKLKRKYAAAYYGRGLIFSKLKRNRLAAKEFRLYLKFNPNTSKTSNLRSFIRKYDR